MTSDGILTQSFILSYQIQMLRLNLLENSSCDIKFNELFELFVSFQVKANSVNQLSFEESKQPHSRFHAVAVA